MNGKIIFSFIFSFVLTLQAGVVAAQGASGAAEKRELIYCADLMSHEEREAYRARMRSARSPDEKARLRAEHRVQMEARAAERGVPCVHRRGEGPGPAGQPR
ncbi:MAG: hypothetical protein N2690_04790 [Rhodocyclaceae bacterium]|nr:hypothetical protein [Rhodocyclaceae bacterium]